MRNIGKAKKEDVESILKLYKSQTWRAVLCLG